MALMIGENIFSGLSFPAPIESVFNPVISIGWFDGTTSGLALNALRALAFRFDLLDWGPGQEMRIFALSPLPIPEFEEAVKLFGTSQSPKAMLPAKFDEHGSGDFDDWQKFFELGP